MAKNGHSKFFQQFFPKRWEEIWNGKKWQFQIFSNNFPQKRLEEIWNGQNWAFQINSNLFVLKDWKKFEIAKFGHSEFMQTFFGAKRLE